MSLTMFKADMHCHSTCSDGSLTPHELLLLAKERGLQGLSITDHDSLAAYQPEFYTEAKNLGLHICSGVEFSCHHKEESVHVLGYNIDCTSSTLVNLCLWHQTRRERRNRAILNKLRGFGIIITEEELLASSSSQVLGRPHIAKLLCQKGYVKDPQEAFKVYLADGAKGFVAGETISVQKTIAVIREAKGRAFIAHPHLIRKRKVLKDLLMMPFDGLECYYALFRSPAEKRWIDITEQKGWLISGGSDFHGSLKPNIPLGASWVDEATFFKICSR